MRMTENEAIENFKEKYMDIEYYFAEHNYYMGEYDAEFQEAMATAMKALTEIQHYRAIGTVEECKLYKETCDVCNLAQLSEYREIGTIEELKNRENCFKAREKYIEQILLERDIAIHKLEEKNNTSLDDAAFDLGIVINEFEKYKLNQLENNKWLSNQEKTIVQIVIEQCELILKKYCIKD